VGYVAAFAGTWPKLLGGAVCFVFDLAEFSPAVIFSCAIEALENRGCFPRPSALHSGVLTITGTAGNDAIAITANAANPANLNITVNGTTKTFARSQVSSIVVCRRRKRQCADDGARCAPSPFQ